MMDFLRSGGVMMWPILATALLAAVATVRAVMALRRNALEPAQRSALSVLFWGGMAAALGLLGTIVGIAQVARVMDRYAGAPASLVWNGMGVTLVTTITGLLVFIVALLSWYALQARLPGAASGNSR